MTSILGDIEDVVNWASRQGGKKKRKPKKIKREKKQKIKIPKEKKSKDLNKKEKRGKDLSKKEKKGKDLSKKEKKTLKQIAKDTKAAAARGITNAKNKVKAKAAAAKDSVKRGLSKGKQKIMNKKLIGLFLTDKKAEIKLEKNIKAALAKMENNKIYHMITSEKAGNKPELTDKKAIKKYTTKLSKERKRFLKLHRTWVKNLRRLGKLNRKRDIVPTPDQAKVLGPKKLYEDMSDSEYDIFNDSEIEEWTEYEYDSDDYSSEDEYEEYNVNLKF